MFSERVWLDSDGFGSFELSVLIVVWKIVVLPKVHLRGWRKHHKQQGSFMRSIFSHQVSSNHFDTKWLDKGTFQVLPRKDFSITSLFYRNNRKKTTSSPKALWKEYQQKNKNRSTDHTR